MGMEEGLPLMQEWNAASVCRKNPPRRLHRHFPPPGFCNSRLPHLGESLPRSVNLTLSFQAATGGLDSSARAPDPSFSVHVSVRLSPKLCRLRHRSCLPTRVESMRMSMELSCWWPGKAPQQEGDSKPQSPSGRAPVWGCQGSRRGMEVAF